MPHGAINYAVVVDGEFVNTLRYPDGTSATYRYGRVAKSASRSRPNNSVNPKDSSGWRSPSPFFHNADIRNYGYCTQLSTLADGTRASGYGPMAFVDGTNFNHRDVFPQSLEDLCVTKALNALYDGQSGWAENLWMYGEYAEFVADKADLLTRAYRTFRGQYPLDWLNAKTAASLGKALPPRWLELQYGITPTLADVYDASRVIAQRTTDNSGRREVHASMRTVETVLGHDVATCIGSPFSVSVLRRSEYRSRVHLSFQIGAPWLYLAGQLNLDNPADLAWNLLPFSFVVDWFLPIDSFLTSIAAPWGLSFMGGTITRYTSSRVAVSDPRPAEGLAVSISNVNRNCFDLTRSVLDSFPGARVPHLKNPISLTHWANAMSLLAGVFSK